MMGRARAFGDAQAMAVAVLLLKTFVDFHYCFGFFIETRKSWTANTNNTAVVACRDLFSRTQWWTKRWLLKPPFGGPNQGRRRRRRKKHGFSSHPHAHTQGPNIPFRQTAHSDIYIYIYIQHIYICVCIYVYTICIYNICSHTPH